MHPIVPRLHTANRYAGLLGALLVCGVLPRGADAQVRIVRDRPLDYAKPPASAKRIQIDHVQGQVVFRPATPPGMFPAANVQVALFDEKHTLVSSDFSGESGQFEITDVASGNYTLVAGKDTLDILSVPLHVRVGKSERASIVSALLLKMRSKTDSQKSAAATITNNSLRTELLGRVARDQAIRKEWIQNGIDKPNKELEARMQAIDADNLARMKEIVRRYHWPGPGLVGLDGSEAAFLMVQHAPYAFQKEMLPRVRNAYRAGELSGQNYALLTDRVLVREGKKQIYGTQARPLAEWKNGEPALDPIEDEANVDQRRSEVGLFPLAEYKRLMKEMYFPKGRGKP